MISPIKWAALALGVIDRFTKELPRKQLDVDSERFDPSMQLRSFGFVYPILLKVAILSRNRGSQDSKMAALLDWMYHLWHFSAPAIILATQMFSTSRPKGVFKKIDSPEKTVVLSGVRNTTWDLVYITEWFKRIKSQSERKELSVICSRDAALIKSAELLRQNMFENMAPTFLLTAGFGKAVQERYDQYVKDQGNTKSALVPWPEDFDPYRDKLVADLEDELVPGYA